MTRSVNILAFVAASALSTVGCGQTPNGSASEVSQGADNVGSVALDLDIGNSVQIDTVGYEITGPSFEHSGTIDVSKSAGASAIVDSIPFGSAYAVTMTASSTSTPRFTCSGSTPFGVSASGVTAVAVHLTCKEVISTPPPPGVPVPIPFGANEAASVLLLAAGLGLIGRGSRKSPEAQ